jgi:hypothetical protein
MRDRPWISGVLAALAMLALLVLAGTSSLPLVGFWLAVSIGVGWMWRTSGRVLRVGLSLALVPLCVLMTFEGGLLFLPAAFALAGSSLARKRRVEAPLS